MSWRVAIRHISRYDYGQPVTTSFNEVRMTPMTTDRQVTHDARVEIEPHVRALRYVDYWGTYVDAFDVQAPHSALVVTGSSLVETSPPPSRGSGVTWSDLGDPAIIEQMAEFLEPPAYTEPGPAITEAAAALRELPTPRDAVESACAWVHARLAYEPGSTHVSTSATEALETAAGVCQDF